MTITPAQIAALFALRATAPLFGLCGQPGGVVHVATGDGRRWEMLPGGTLTVLDSVTVS